MISFVKKFIFFFSLSLVLAAPAEALVISPVKMFFTVERGDGQEIFLTVRNNETKNITVHPVVFGVKQDVAGRPVFVTGELSQEQWVRVNNKKIDLKPGEKKEVLFAFVVPAGVLPGSYNLGLGVEEDGVKESGVGLNSRLLSLLELVVSGEAQENIAVESWQTQKNIFFSPNFSFVLKIKNLGNVDSVFNEKILISNWRGVVVANWELMDKKILSQSSLVFSPEINLSDKKMLWPGWHDASLIINYGLTKQVINQTIKIWYFPVWFLVIVGVFLFFVVMGIFYKNKRNKIYKN